MTALKDLVSELRENFDRMSKSELQRKYKESKTKAIKEKDPRRRASHHATASTIARKIDPSPGYPNTQSPWEKKSEKHAKLSDRWQKRYEKLRKLQRPS